VGERNEDPSLGDLRLTTCYLAPGLFSETWLFAVSRGVANSSLTVLWKGSPLPARNLASSQNGASWDLSEYQAC
jgi:hypothetical protein